MKLNLPNLPKLPDVMGFIRGVFTDPRNKRLWPIAAVLLAAIVAVPVLLSSSSSATPIAQAPQGSSGPSPQPAIPTLSVQSTPVQSHLTGRGRNPFVQQVSTTATKASSSTASTSSTGSSASSGSSSGGGSSTGGAASGGSSTPVSPPSSSSGSPSHKQSGLSSTDAYHVTLALTNSAGDLNTIDPLERLSVLPSQQQPLLVEIGVMEGGHSVLFVVQPGAVVTGPGTCTPGPIDCEILSLAPGKTETLSEQSQGGVNQIALFAVTAITTDHYSSAAAANKARTTASSAGRTLLNESSYGALSLFHFDPSVGAVVDLRNLTIGGS